MNTIKKTCFGCLFILILNSCEGNGPKSSFTQPEKTMDEIVEETLNSVENDTYVYMGSVELYYYDNGWSSAGMHNLYNYPNGNKSYVLFGSSDYMPVYIGTYKGNYNHCVKYRGTDFYY